MNASTTALSVNSSFTPVQLSAPVDYGYEIIDQAHVKRPRVEQFITRRFRDAHGAHISNFMPRLIIVGQRNDINQEMREYILRGLLWPLTLLLPFILWLLLYLLKVVLEPLQRVSDEVNRQDFRHLKTINVEGVPEETYPLVISFNQMINKLDDAYTRERRFVSDASHELRNPLAALLVNVENAIEEIVSVTIRFE